MIANIDITGITETIANTAGIDMMAVMEKTDIISMKAIPAIIALMTRTGMIANNGISAIL